MFKLQMRTMDLFLLLALILTGAPRAADGQESETVKVREGHEAILPCSVSTNMESESFDWRNKDKEVFFYEKGAPSGNERDGQHKDFKGRVFHFQDELKDGNASIRITNTKMADSGAYSCYLPNQDKWCYVQLVVGVCPKPFFNHNESTNTWDLLQCEVSRVSPYLQLKIMNSSGIVPYNTMKNESKSDGTYDVVLRANVTKSGVYSCVVTQEDICHQISSSTSVYVHGSALSNMAPGGAVVLVLLFLDLMLIG